MDEFQEYPKWLYLNGNSQTSKLVNSQEEETALGDEWIDEILEQGGAS